MQAAAVELLSLPAGDAVAVEHDHDLTAREGGVVAQRVHKPLARGINVAAVGQGAQLVPRENDVVAIHDHALAPGVEQLGALCLVRTGRGVAHGGGILRAADRAELALQDLLQLPVVKIKPAAEHPRRRRGRLRLRLAETGVEVHIIAHAVPRDDRARTVRAEHAVRRVIKVARGVVAALSDDLLRVVAGVVASDAARDAPAPAGVGCDLCGVIPHRGHRRAAGEHSHVAVRLG